MLAHAPKNKNKNLGDEDKQEQFTKRHSFPFCISFFSGHRCTPPNKSSDFQKIYSDWCHEFEKYKSAMKTWEKKQQVSVLLYFLYFILCLPKHLFRMTRFKSFVLFLALVYQSTYNRTYLYFLTCICVLITLRGRNLFCLCGRSA